MSDSKSICIFCGGYPTPDNPSFAFIQPLARAFADAGVDVSVVCQQSLTRAIIKRKKLRPDVWYDETEAGNKIQIIQPKNITVSTVLRVINNQTAVLATRRLIKKLKVDPDVAYGHFWHSGVFAHKIFPNKPLFVVSGESEIWVNDVWDEKSINQTRNAVDGLIAVSTKNYKESVSLGLCDDNINRLVIPNGIDPEKFYKIDQAQAREKLGFNMHDIIAIFVGAFSERKGVRRFIEASNRFPDLKIILIGSGDDSIKAIGNVLFCGRVSHDDICVYLNAADMFVLPTQAEGCCNAIVEAMACGLPIISSDGDFNDDILDETNSIRINPNDVDQIASAIGQLIDNRELREKLGAGSLKKANKLSISKRAKDILDFVFKE